MPFSFLRELLPSIRVEHAEGIHQPSSRAVAEKRESLATGTTGWERQRVRVHADLARVYDLHV